MMGEDQLLAVNMNGDERYAALKDGRGPGEAIHVNSIALSGDTLNVEAEPEMTLQYRIDCIPETSLKPFNVIEHPGVLGRGEMTAFCITMMIRRTRRCMRPFRETTLR